jgi:hypothetical protein
MLQCNIRRCADARSGPHVLQHIHAVEGRSMSGITFEQSTHLAQPSNQSNGPGPFARIVTLLAGNANRAAEQMTERYLHRQPCGGGINWLSDGLA